MTPYLVFLAFVAGMAAERYGRTGLWWMRWAYHRLRGHHS